MLFPTVEFALFFLAVLAIAWTLNPWRRVHNGFLLAASYLFYGFWDWHYVPLLFGISVFSGWVAQRIEAREEAAARKRWLVFGVVGCLSALVYFKYTRFLLMPVLHLVHAGTISPTLSRTLFPSLPIGISFFVFHAISLLSDCYKRKLKQPTRMEDALLYIAFFPQLIAGPILRATQFIPQLHKVRDAGSIRVNRAFLLILAGLVKKVLLSNILATRLVEPVFTAPSLYHGADTLLAIYGYAAQIYCDFSGYTDIATGCALLLGYHFPRNFNAPYTAVDPSDFWRRWHISLSSWLRDYLYIGLLGGNRKGSGWTYFNLLATMLLGGLWHGANWTFVVWGGLHGSYLVIHRLWQHAEHPQLVALRQTGWWRWVSRLLLFHAVCFAWIFFRAPTFGLAFQVIRQLGVRGGWTLASAPVVAVLVLGLFGQFSPARWRRGVELEMNRWPAAVTGAAVAFCLFAIEMLGPTGVAPFIYFQF